VLQRVAERALEVEVVLVVAALADDVMAAIYGNLILRAAIFVAPTLFVR